ncbi:Unknown protein [Striga hermonthica]|uniref:Uncharacterized protein n=1 Tax=Striga hermonthica TaxID=68872 RepID=A0A9N7P0M1_STRHE|nr:Unknown protein [Striga hermonthica]
MGSVGFNGEVESQPSASNYKLLVGCDGGTHALVPRKLRSAIKKRAREMVTSPLSISKKRRASNKEDSLKKYGRKNSKPKRAHITKDEEEVAETLYALASMFFDPNKANRLLNNSQENGGSSNAVEGNALLLLNNPLPFSLIRMVKLPQYPSSSMHPQKQWLAQHNSGVGPTHLNDWKNGSTGPPPPMVNCARRALLPHLLGPTKDQQFMSSAISSSSLPLQNMKINSRYHQQLLHNRQIPLGFFERNLAAFCSDNIQQLQLP